MKTSETIGSNLFSNDNIGCKSLANWWPLFRPSLTTSLSGCKSWPASSSSSGNSFMSVYTGDSVVLGAVSSVANSIGRPSGRALASGDSRAAVRVESGNCRPTDDNLTNTIGWTTSDALAANRLSVQLVAELLAISRLRPQSGDINRNETMFVNTDCN